MSTYSVRVAGVTKVTQSLSAINDFLRDPQPMQDTVDDIKDVINEKTSSGRDYANKPFAPYSKAYAKRKGKRRVDLRDTGQMLNSIQTKVSGPNHGSVFVAGGRAQIAEYHNEGGTRHQTFRKGSDIMTGGILPKRRFMDINKAQLAKIIKKNFDDKIMKILGRR